MMRVLFSTRNHAMDRNPYLRQLEEHLSGRGLSVAPWTWRTALFGRYDILHVHWPEYIVTHRRRGLAAIHAVLSSLLFGRLRVLGTAVVLTVHNEEPHFPVNRGAKRRLARLNRLVNERIQLHEAPATAHQTVIPHGDYKGWYDKYRQVPSVPGRILFFGLIREYKNVPRLIESFRSLVDTDLTLHIVGEPDDDELRRELVGTAHHDPRVHLDLRFASEADLAAEISSASLVVLPYRHVFNSGAALLALSLERRLLVADSESMQLLSDEVGNQWVTTYEGDLSPDDIAGALALADSGAKAPDLDDRSWTRGAHLHVQVYRRATGQDRTADEESPRR